MEVGTVDVRSFVFTQVLAELETTSPRPRPDTTLEARVIHGEDETTAAS